MLNHVFSWCTDFAWSACLRWSCYECDCVEFHKFVIVRLYASCLWSFLFVCVVARLWSDWNVINNHIINICTYACASYITYMYMYIYIYIYIHAYMHTCNVHACIQSENHRCINLHMHIRIRLKNHRCMDA